MKNIAKELEENIAGGRWKEDILAITSKLFLQNLLFFGVDKHFLYHIKNNNNNNASKIINAKEILHNNPLCSSQMK